MRQRTVARASSLILLCVASLLIAVTPVTAQDLPVFEIGVLDAFNGPITSGARLAVQAVNDAGGVAGADGNTYRLSLVIEPPTDGQSLEQAVINLDQADVVAVIGPANNEDILNFLPTLQSLNVPVLTPANGDTVITSDTTGRLIRMRAAEVYEGRALAAFLISGLGVTDITTVQLDLASTAGVVGFTTAATALGVTPEAALLETGDTVESLADELLESDPPVLVAYGNPALAGELYNRLRLGGWQGQFSYRQALEPAFRLNVPVEQLNGVISTTTWPYTAVDLASENFLLEYVRTYGEIPNEVAAASYDAVNLIVDALGEPGTLAENIASLGVTEGVQGLLTPADLPRGEISTNVSVVVLGPFGAPIVVARYRDGNLLPLDDPDIIQATPIPATPTPEGVVITITSARQNIRSGPGTQYDVIGQLNEGEQVRVIGASSDNAWVVINFRGQEGWLATYLLDVFGDLNTVPIFSAPPTPTPGFTPTPIPPPEADLVIDSATVAPQPVVVNQPFNASVIIRNAGNSPAGQFAVAATFPPNNVYTAVVIPGLLPGQSVVANLPVTLNNTGFYTVSILVDLNNEVPEGPAGEANNVYNLSYVVDEVVRNQGSQTLNLGDTIDLEGDLVQGDANWNAEGGVLGLKAIFGSQLGLIAGTDINQVHWDLINPAVINQSVIPRTSITPGSLIGIITADGNRGVMRVDSVSDTQLSVTFKVYQR